MELLKLLVNPPEVMTEEEMIDALKEGDVVCSVEFEPWYSSNRDSSGTLHESALAKALKCGHKLTYVYYGEVVVMISGSRIVIKPETYEWESWSAGFYDEDIGELLD